MNRQLHNCIFVNTARTYIYRRMIGLPVSNCVIQPNILALRTKLYILIYH